MNTDSKVKFLVSILKMFLDTFKQEKYYWSIKWSYSDKDFSVELQSISYLVLKIS